MSKIDPVERQEAVMKLKQWLKPGDTLFTILRRTSASGMSRDIGVVIIGQQPGAILHPDYAVSKALGWRLSKRDGIIVTGCGQDMGFHLVYSVSRLIFPDGFGVIGRASTGGKTIRPTSPKHAAALVKAGVKFHGRNGDPSGWDNDGGYALNQRWL